jgi:hypothetical protein
MVEFGLAFWVGNGVGGLAIDIFIIPCAAMMIN